MVGAGADRSDAQGRAFRQTLLAMGVETEIFAGAQEDLEAALPLGPVAVDALPSFHASPLDQIQLSSLGQLLLDGSLNHDDPASYGSTYDELMKVMGVPAAQSDPDEGPWIFIIPNRLKDALAAIPPERVDEVATEWATTEEVGGEWGIGDSAPDYVRLLSELARAAKRTDRNLYLWGSL